MSNINKDDLFKKMFEGITGEDGKVYRCVKCSYPLEKIMVKTVSQDYKKLFYCKRNKCERFGTITVVVQKI